MQTGAAAKTKRSEPRQYALGVPHRLVAVLVLLLATAALAVPLASARQLPGFRSPTANIRCFVLVGHSGDLLCTIGSSSYAKALQTRCISGGVGVDWHGFTLGATGKATLNCSGGIQYDPATDRLPTSTLAYGSKWRSGAYTCASSSSGVTCHNRHGHGLFVSRTSWRTW
jgi:hypothetical protein